MSNFSIAQINETCLWWNIVIRSTHLLSAHAVTPTHPMGPVSAEGIAPTTAPNWKCLKIVWSPNLKWHLPFLSSLHIILTEYQSLIWIQTRPKRWPIQTIYTYLDIVGESIQLLGYAIHLTENLEPPELPKEPPTENQILCQRLLIIAPLQLFLLACIYLCRSKIMFSLNFPTEGLACEAAGSLGKSVSACSGPPSTDQRSCNPRIPAPGINLRATWFEIWFGW